MEYEIIHLPKEKWKGTIIRIKYSIYKYYNVNIKKTVKGFTIEIEKKDFKKPVTLTIVFGCTLDDVNKCN